MNAKNKEQDLKKQNNSNTLGIEGLSTQPNTASKRENVELPIEFARYRLLKVLGEGGMGAVYLAHDTELDRKVALKLPHFSGGRSKDQSERFRREARLAANLSHPNICRIHDIGEHDAQMYLTMEYVEGKTLNDIVKAKGAIEPRTAVNLVKRIASAVQVAHAQGIIHRDLKPANIMIKKDRDFVIMDFGLARRVEQEDVQLTATGAVLGTPAYMAPEQLRGENNAVGPQSDVYSLGIILYELLTGQRPFQGTLPQIYAQVLNADSVSPSTLKPGMDTELDAICRQATAADVKQRYRTAEEFAKALGGYLAGRSQSASDPFASALAPIVSYQPTIKNSKATLTTYRKPIAIGSMVGLAVLVFVGAFLFRRSNTQTMDEPLAKVESTTPGTTPQTPTATPNASAANTSNHSVLLASTSESPNATSAQEQESNTGAAPVPSKSNAPRQVTLKKAESMSPPNSQCYAFPLQNGRSVYVSMGGEGLNQPGVYKVSRSSDTSNYQEPSWVVQGRLLAISQDERYAIALDTNGVLCEGLRSAPSESFDSLSPIREFEGTDTPKSPSLSSDGLTLVFQRTQISSGYPNPKQESGRTPEFVICKREGLDKSWGKPMRIPMAPNPIYDGSLTWPMMSDDGLVLTFSIGTGRSPKIGYATRTDPNVAFDNPRLVVINGEQLVGRAPKYVKRTQELYYAKPTDTTSYEVWVVKNFAPLGNTNNLVIATSQSALNQEPATSSQNPSQASRNDQSSGQRSSSLQLSELSETPEGLNCSVPTLTKDGLTLFCSGSKAGDTSKSIWTANRKDHEGLFEKFTKVFSGNEPTVSTDGLELVFVDPVKNIGLWSATRASTNDTFKRPNVISEFAQERLTNPFLTNSDLVLYAHRLIAEKGKFEIVRTSRPRRGAPWSKLEVVPISGNLDISLGSVSNDEKFLLGFSRPDYQGKSKNDLYVLTRTGSKLGFEKPTSLNIPDLPTSSTFPRYSEVNRELLFSSYWQGQKARLWIVRDFDPATISNQSSSISGKNGVDSVATLKAMQGEWKCVAMEELGNTIDSVEVRNQNRLLTIKGNSLTLSRTVGGQRGSYKGKFEIDSSTGFFDFVGNAEFDNNGKGGFREWIGIFKLDDDKLELCFRYKTNDAAKRPTGFRTDEEKPNKSVYYTFKRIPEMKR
jgi:uncharacterized protein (TIGR03067 family)